MFETILAFCLVFDGEGKPTSPCWMQKENRVFENYAVCHRYAQYREDVVMSQIVQEYEMPTVVTVVCAPVGESS